MYFYNKNFYDNILKIHKFYESFVKLRTIIQDIKTYYLIANVQHIDHKFQYNANLQHHA